MKKLLFLTTLLTLGLIPAWAQPGGPQFDAAMSKVFGANQAFSATMETQADGPMGKITIPGKISFDNGKSRFEVDMSAAKSDKFPPQAVQIMKDMGMDVTLAITRPDLKLNYVIYPHAHGYVGLPINDPTASANPSDFKLETTELGKETIDGHACVKNKAVVTDKQGAKHEYTLWCATDLKSFPIQITLNDDGTSVVMTFKNLSFDKPAASLFEAPKDCTKYDSIQAMQTSFMQKMAAQKKP